MKLLLLFPLNEPFDTVVNAGKMPWKMKLSAQKTIKKIDCVYPTGLLSIGAYVRKFLPDAEIRILDCNVVMNQLADVQGTFNRMLMSETIKYALIIVASVPVLCLYPFLQKYFVQGVMIGSVKG